MKKISIGLALLAAAIVIILYPAVLMRRRAPQAATDAPLEAAVIPAAIALSQPSVSPLNNEQIDDLRASIRRKAAAINIDRLLQLPSKEGEFSPLFSEPVPKADDLKTARAPDRSEATTKLDPAKNVGHPVSTTDQSTQATRAESRKTRLPFDPYPHDAPPVIPELATGYHPAVPVLAPGRLDWTFVSSRRSLDPQPSAEMKRYEASRQSYELYIPPGHDPQRFYPLIIHVTPGGHSDAWAIWKGTCQRHGLILAGPHNAGNDVDMPRRCRIVLDVLDDVRRRFRIDPDRTYISGTSGGGHAASEIAFALPELFGGNIAIVGTWNLRLEPMVRRRVRDRLSVAVVTGAGDFNGPEMAREFYPVLVAHHVRARLWLYPDMGHGVPNAGRLEEIFEWVEAGLPERRALGTAFPSSRLVEPLTPEAWATSLIVEAGERLKLPESTSGLFMLKGVAERWQGLPEAEVAEKLLREFDTSAPMNWQAIYRAELLRFRYLQARAFDGILNSPLPSNYPVPRSNLVHIAIDLWERILDLAPADSSVAKEAKSRLAELKKSAR
jgi:hypothetical protein